MHSPTISSLSPFSLPVSLDFSSGEKWRKHVGYTAGFSVYEKSAQHRGEYTRRARRIMGICGRQVAKLYREAGNKRANGSYVRREILWRRVCKGLGSACGLTSIKPSKSYLSRLATGGLILLFNVCSLSLFRFPFFHSPFRFFPFSFALLSRNNIFRRSFLLLAPRPTFHPLVSSFLSLVFFFCFLLAAYSGRYLVTIPRESRTGWSVGW